MSASPALQQFLNAWHMAVRSRDMTMLEPHVAEDAVIASPMFWKPKGPRPYVMAILTHVMGAFEDFHYTKEWLDGDEALLEFEARIGTVGLKGIDRFTVDAQGRMTRIEVLIRPMNALQALGAAVMAGLAKQG